MPVRHWIRRRIISETARGGQLGIRRRSWKAGVTWQRDYISLSPGASFDRWALDLAGLKEAQGCAGLAACVPTTVRVTTS